MRYWHWPHPSLCLSVPFRRTPLGGFAAVGPAGKRYRSIAARPAVSSSRAAAVASRRANAGNAALSADA